MPPRVQKKRRELTPEELIRLEKYAALRLPVRQIAALLDWNESDMLQASKKHKSVRQAIEQGRAKAGHNIRRTLYQMAVGDQREDGTYKTKPDFQALRFWALTQERFRYESNTDENGNPMRVGVHAEQNQEGAREMIVILPSNNREKRDKEKE